MILSKKISGCLPEIKKGRRDAGHGEQKNPRRLGGDKSQLMLLERESILLRKNHVSVHNP